GDGVVRDDVALGLPEALALAAPDAPPLGVTRPPEPEPEDTLRLAGLAMAGIVTGPRMDGGAPERRRYAPARGSTGAGHRQLRLVRLQPRPVPGRGGRGATRPPLRCPHPRPGRGARPRRRAHQPWTGP